MRTLVTVLIAIGLVSGCGGGGGDAYSALSKVIPPAAKNGGSISFTFQTVDDPASTTNSVNGIDQSGEIVGNIGSNTASSPYLSYVSAPPYTSFQSIAYTGSLGTVAEGVTRVGSTITIVGWVIFPPQLPGIWSFVQINGMFTLMRDRKGGKGYDTATELFGVNDAHEAVGFYKNTSGNDVPVIVNILNESFTGLKPPGYTNAAATGINNLGDIVGWEVKSGKTIGWYTRLGAYSTFSYPNAKATYGRGLNTADLVVGYSVDNAGIDHGFILTNPKGKQKWQAIDEPDAAYGTVVTGINDANVICGYYIDAGHVQHGFVATPKS